MALPSSGAISLWQIAQELNVPIEGLSLGDQRVRDLLGDQDAVYMSNAYNKSAMNTMTIGRWDNSGRTYLGYQGASPTGTNYGGWMGNATPYGIVKTLIIQRWSQYDNKIILQTNNMYQSPAVCTFIIQGQTFTFTVKTNDLNGFSIPNTMSDLFMVNTGQQIKISIK